MHAWPRVLRATVPKVRSLFRLRSAAPLFGAPPISFLLLWLATFPMSLIGEFGWMAPPADFSVAQNAVANVAEVAASFAVARVESHADGNDFVLVVWTFVLGV